jgi:MEMO1 family protein
LDSQHGYVIDELRQCPEPLRLQPKEFACAKCFDGQRTLREIQAAARSQDRGAHLTLEELVELTRRLDEALLLEGPRWRQRVESPDREPACIGCYDGDPGKLSRQVGELFACSDGVGLPRQNRADGGLQAALVPHIDYARGGACYARGFKEVFERTDASLFVIVGTSHYSQQRFTVTRKNFKTPLGSVPTDQEFIDRLVRHFGSGLFDDELQAHLPEHSIELEVVMLQWYYARRRPIRIVPMVVGSFHDAILLGRLPSEIDDIRRMVHAFRRAVAETCEPICILISGDLAHIGPKFQPSRSLLNAADLAHSREQDLALLKLLEAADARGLSRVLAQEKDARSICGYPPAFTVLEAIRPGTGKVLLYDRYVHPAGRESVSFASVGFYGIA